MEHQNWDYTVYSKGPKGGEKGDKAVNKAIREGKDVETIKKGIKIAKIGFFSIFKKIAQATNKKAAPTGSAIHKAMESEEFKSKIALFSVFLLRKSRTCELGLQIGASKGKNG